MTQSQTGRKLLVLAGSLLACTSAVRGEYPKFCPEMQTVHGGGVGPRYTYEMGKFEITNVQFAAFLNDAEWWLNFDPNATVREDWMVFNSLGDVGLPLAGGQELFDIVLSGLIYDPLEAPGCRYTSQLDSADHAATGMTWLGAVKFCNWLTIDQQLGVPRCYTEGPNVNDWRPVTIGAADWLLRDLNDAERLALLGLRGYRLPMDNVGSATGWVANPENAFNEWYKAAAFDPAAPGVARSGPAGESISAFHWVYGFGRDLIAGRDANYQLSGDPFDDGTTPVGFYDGTVYNPDATPDEDQVPDPGDFETNPNANQYGIFDLSGNVSEWGQDRPLITGRVYHDGSSGTVSDELATTRRNTASPTTSLAEVGLRVVRVIKVADCQPNGVPDDQEIAGGLVLDLDGNQVPDDCDTDCNGNLVADGVDLDPNDPDGDGFVADDLNFNGIPDECEPPWPIPTQACCQGALCSLKTPAACVFAGGAPMGLGSECLGDLTQDLINDVCQPLQIVGGEDNFVTPPGGATYDFCDTPIPAGFFGPGSLPFDQPVSFGEGQPDPPDTTMERGPLDFPTGYPASASTTLTLKCMHVYGCDPIVVQFQGGATELWEVQFIASGAAGFMDAELIQGPYGQFTAQFEVKPRFIFTRVGSPCDDCPPPDLRCSACFDPLCVPDQCPGLTDCCPDQGANCAGGGQACASPGLSCCRELDTTSCGFPPMWLASSRPTGFTFEGNDNGTPLDPADDFYEFKPGVTLKDGMLAPPCCELICHGVATLPGLPPQEGHQHCVLADCTACVRGACCNAAVGCEVVDGEAACNGEYKGNGSDCSDSDGDGIPDVMEINDCCLDADEACNVRTNPLEADTDGGGCDDGFELANAMDPCDACDDAFVPGCGPPANDCNGNGIPDECEPDCDCDGIPDGCELDTDGDNTPDDCEACPGEPALTNPSEVPETTCGDGIDNDCDGNTDEDDADCPCVRPCGDIDGSGGSVNLADFATFALCFGKSPSLSVGCRCSDLDGNGAINLGDFATFTLTFGGVSPNVPPNCP